MNDFDWQVTFADMLTLLLTFFIFILSVSTFKTEEYNRFWKFFQENKIGKKAATRSFKFELIPGIERPELSLEADKLLNELEEVFQETTFQGLDLHYNENKISIIVPASMSFYSGQAELREDAHPFLLGLIPRIQESKFTISIEGHTDSVVSEKIDNMELSLERALSVARFMISKGIEKGKIAVGGYGPYRPVADNNTDEGRAQNRRVEINILIKTK